VQGRVRRNRAVYNKHQRWRALEKKPPFPLVTKQYMREGKGSGGKKELTGLYSYNLVGGKSARETRAIHKHIN